MSRRLQLSLRLVGLVALLVLAGSAAPGSAYGSSAESDAPVDFAASGRATAAEVAYDRPGTTIWAPTVQFATGYTQSSVTNDPTVHGVGASLYPGGLILVCTEGVTGRCPVAYPLWARSTNPGEKLDAPAGQRFANRDGSVVVESQTAHVETSDQPRALGTASSGRALLAGVLSVDSMASSSESVRDGKTIVSRSTATVGGILLGDGALRIQSLVSQSSASLGDAAEAASAVVVQGATFNNMQVTIDDQGVRVVDPSVPKDQADEVSKALNDQLLKQFGARVTLAQSPTEKKADLATAETNGLRVSFVTSEGGQGAPWCDPAKGLPPISNCQQFDNVEIHLGASSAAVSRTLGEPSGGLLDVGADVPVTRGDQADAASGDGSLTGGDLGTAGYEPAADYSTSTLEPPGSSFGGGTSGGGVSAGASARAPRADRYGGELATTVPIRRTVREGNIRAGQVGLLCLQWALAAICLLILLRRARSARGRAAELGL